MSTTQDGMPIACLNLPKPDKARIAYAKGILADMSADAQFAAMSPTAAAVQNDITAYDKAEVAAGTRAVGAVKVRNAARLVVTQDLRYLCHFVQGLADKAPSPAAAAAIIASAGMSVKKVGKRNKPPFAVKGTGTSGSVRLDALRVALSAMYFWQFSLDQKVWTSVTETMKAYTVITGLTPGQTYYFRFNARTRSGALIASQVVSLIVQ